MSQAAVEELRGLLREEWSDLPEDRREVMLRYYALLLEENERQNLTRLTSPQDFFWGNCEDVRVLARSGFLEFPALDLGSGAGLPGIISAIAGGGQWILCDSEKKKAEFLQRVVQELGLGGISVSSARGEDLLRKEKVGSIVARAIGPISRIFGWIGRCSTWNNIVLLKGPSWDEEWAEFEKAHKKKELVIHGQPHAYEVGPERKKRLIVRLDRVRPSPKLHSDK